LLYKRKYPTDPNIQNFDDVPTEDNQCASNLVIVCWGVEAYLYTYHQSVPCSDLSTAAAST